MNLQLTNCLLKFGLLLPLSNEHMSKLEKVGVRNTKRFINRVGIENLDRLFKLQIAGINGSTNRDDISNTLELKDEVERILTEKQPLSVRDLEVSGYDLLQLGIPQGKEIGEILHGLMEAVLDNPELNHKEKLMSLVKDQIRRTR